MSGKLQFQDSICFIPFSFKFGHLFIFDGFGRILKTFFIVFLLMVFKFTLSYIRFNQIFTIHAVFSFARSLHFPLFIFNSPLKFTFVLLIATARPLKYLAKEIPKKIFNVKLLKKIFENHFCGVYYLYFFRMNTKMKILGQP